MIRVLLVDDHAMVRTGIAALLAATDDIEVVGQAADGAAAVAAVPDDGPDVVLMDLSMPGVDGVEATRLILGDHPDVRVLVLTSFSDRDRVSDALAAGAVGYQLKDCEPAELLAAVRAAAAGHVPIDPRVARVLLPDRTSGSARGPDQPSGDRGPAAGHPGPRQQADRPPARHQRAHRQGPPRPGVPPDRRRRPHQRGALGAGPPGQVHRLTGLRRNRRAAPDEVVSRAARAPGRAIEPGP